MSGPNTQATEEARGEAFAQALYGILALHGPSDLGTRERLELGHFLCLATTDWVRARNRTKATGESAA
jgi:hypothetical protein